MNYPLAKTALLASTLVALGMLTVQSASAQQTPAQAMASVGFLAGTWHCTGAQMPAEDDTYTINGNSWRDTDSNGGLTAGTFDAKRQKWVIMVMGSDGRYSVSEAAAMSASGPLVATIVYPAGITDSYQFNKVSDTQYTLGNAKATQTCTKRV